MSIRKSHIPLIACALVLPCAINAVGAEKDNPLSLSLKAGLQYDDNITVDAQDLTSTIGDGSAQFQGAIGYKLKSDDNFKLSTEYSFFQRLYQDQTEFDLQIHGLSLNASTKLGNATLGASYRYNYTFLGRENFLDIHSLTPNVRFQPLRRLFVTLAYEYQQQDFKQLSLNNRDATRHSFSTKTLYSFGKGRTLSAAYKLMRHDTKDAELDYWGHRVTLGVKLPFNIAENKIKFRGRYRYRNKAFMNINSSIGEKRSDIRHTFRASLETAFLDTMLAKIQYEYIDSNSNLASLTYTEQVVTLSLGWRL